MNTSRGCIEHEVLLDNADVAIAPTHSDKGSLGSAKERCPDCGAEPSGYHHPNCDWARTPSGGQLLSHAVDYRRIGDEWNDSVVFPVIWYPDWKEGDDPAILVSRTKADAKDFIVDAFDHADEYTLKATSIVEPEER